MSTKHEQGCTTFAASASDSAYATPLGEVRRGRAIPSIANLRRLGRPAIVSLGAGARRSDSPHRHRQPVRPPQSGQVRPTEAGGGATALSHVAIPRPIRASSRSVPGSCIAPSVQITNRQRAYPRLAHTRALRSVVERIAETGIIRFSRLPSARLSPTCPGTLPPPRANRVARSNRRHACMPPSRGRDACSQSRWRMFCAQPTASTTPLPASKRGRRFTPPR